VPEVIAVDVGGSSIRAAVVGIDGSVLRERVRETPAADGPDAVVAAVRAVTRELAEPDVVAAGVVVPGVVDVATGVARYSTNLGWRDVPLRELLTGDLSVPVVIEHDVRAAGRAELTLGRAGGANDCLLVWLGTGIAAVVVVAGQIVAGARAMAGELGHLPVYPDGEPCACGQLGCTEVYASGAGIARRYQARAGRARSAAEIATRLATDAAAAAVWTQACDALGLALVSATLLLDPGVIVLGGGLAGAGETLREPVACTLADRLAWRPAPELRTSALAGRAGLLGAALLAWEASGTAPRGQLGREWSPIPDRATDK
jgi:glucokinase